MKVFREKLDADVYILAASEICLAATLFSDGATGCRGPVFVCRNIIDPRYSSACLWHAKAWFDEVLTDDGWRPAREVWEEWETEHMSASNAQ